MGWSGGETDEGEQSGQQAETGTSIGGSEGAPDTGSAMGGDPNFGQAAAANAAAAAAEATGGWDFPDPVGGWATSAPTDTSQTGEDSNASSAQNPLDSAMAIVDAAIANTGMPAIGTGGLPGMGFEGYGTEMGINTPSALGPVGLDGSLQGQATPGTAAPTGVGNPMGYGGAPGGLIGPAQGGPSQNQAAGIGGLSVSNVGATTSPTGVGNPMGYGMSGIGAPIGPGTVEGGAPGGPNQSTQTGVNTAGGPLGHGLEPGGMAPATTDALGNMAAAEAQEADEAGGSRYGLGKGLAAEGGTLDAIAAAAAKDSPATTDTPTTTSQVDKDVEAMRNALKDQPPEDFTTKDDETDPVATGMPIDPATGKPIDSVAYTENFVALQNMRDYYGEYAVTPERAKALLDAAISRSPEFAWDAIDIARGLNPLGRKGPATTQERMDIAVANIQADLDQTAMEMDVSTGEDERALQNFRAKYPWASQMSDFEVQAYINSPELLKLKLDNMKITEQMNNNVNLTTNDVRALWAPPGAGLPGSGQQSAPLYPQG